MSPDVARDAAAALRRQVDAAQRGVDAARRVRLAAAVRLAARRVYAHVDVDIAPDVVLGRRIRVTVEPNTDNVLRIGAGTRVGDDVLVRFSGGRLEIGERVDLRRGVSLNVGGDLLLRGDNVVSWQTAVHCSRRVEVERQVIIGEHVTITDSRHYWTTQDAPIWHNVRSGEIYVGPNTWICAKATLAPDTRIGACCLVAANAVVAGDVPDGSLAAGVPAVVRPNRLPWTESAAE